MKRIAPKCTCGHSSRTHSRLAKTYPCRSCDCPDFSHNGKGEAERLGAGTSAPTNEACEALKWQ